MYPTLNSLQFCIPYESSFVVLETGSAAPWQNYYIIDQKVHNKILESKSFTKNNLIRILTRTNKLILNLNEFNNSELRISPGIEFKKLIDGKRNARVSNAVHG